MRIALVPLIARIARIDLVTSAVKRIDDRRRWCQLIILPKPHGTDAPCTSRGIAKV